MVVTKTRNMAGAETAINSLVLIENDGSDHAGYSGSKLLQTGVINNVHSATRWRLARLIASSGFHINDRHQRSVPCNDALELWLTKHRSGVSGETL